MNISNCSSGKCQIIHWRQGHKDECCPPRTTVPLREGIDFVAVVASRNQFENCARDSEMEGKSEVSSRASSVVDDNVNLRPHADVRGTHTGLTSTNNSSVAGFTSSRSRSELLVDVASNEAPRSSTVNRDERSICDPVASDMSGAKTRIRKTKHTMPPSPESNSSAIDIDGSSRDSKLDKLKSSHNDEVVNLRPQLPKGKTTMSDDVQPAKLGDKKFIRGAASPELLVKDASKFKSSSSLSCLRSDSVTKYSEDDSQHSKGKHMRSLSSSAPRTSSATGRHSMSNSKSVLPSKLSSIPSLPQNASTGLKTSMQKVVQQFRVSKPFKSYLLGSENEVAGKCYDKVILLLDVLSLRACSFLWHFVFIDFYLCFDRQHFRMICS